VFAASVVTPPWMKLEKAPTFFFLKTLEQDGGPKIVEWKLKLVPGLPDYYWHTIPKMGDHMPNCRYLITKWSKNIPNGRNIFKTVKEYQCFPFQGPPKFYPNWEFWFENMPSGNPGWSDGSLSQHYFCLNSFCVILPKPESPNANMSKYKRRHQIVRIYNWPI
jgi:hypothetical protein